MSKTALEQGEAEQLKRLADLRDEDIDLIDIPEAPEENWAAATRGAKSSERTTPITIRLDADVFAQLQRRAPTGDYQREINAILRRDLLENDRQAGVAAAGRS